MSKRISDEQLDWLRNLSRAERFGHHDRLGAVNFIDDAARKRAVSAMSSGSSYSLSRPLRRGDGDEPDFKIAIRTFAEDIPNSVVVSATSDRVEFFCHTVVNTHVDALNHMGMEGTWYSGWEPGDDSGPSIMDWAQSGIFTRGVHVNISSVRGTEWVDASAPVKAEDIEAALASGGIRFMPGDALLLDMGRDRFEATGVQMPPAAATELRPGLGVSGVEWIADNDVSVLCWDFLDAVHPEEPRPFAHYLIWATGLAVVDNCDYSSLRSIDHGSASASIGALVMAPLPIPGGSGCNINPLFIM